MPSANCTCVNPFFFRYSFSNAPSTLIKTISFPLKNYFSFISYTKKREYKIFCVNEKIHTKKEVPSVE
ncbi:hypothetical protein DPX30_05485 [Enterococcus faecium]|nr:hypothetical protein DPX30_05485 [Enterococcus faecium]